MKKSNGNGNNNDNDMLGWLTWSSVKLRKKEKPKKVPAPSPPPAPPPQSPTPMPIPMPVISTKELEKQQLEQEKEKEKIQQQKQQKEEKKLHHRHQQQQQQNEPKVVINKNSLSKKPKKDDDSPMTIVRDCVLKGRIKRRFRILFIMGACILYCLFVTLFVWNKHVFLGHAHFNSQISSSLAHFFISPTTPSIRDILNQHTIQQEQNNQGPRTYQSYQWEESRDTASRSNQCALNQPQLIPTNTIQNNNQQTKEDVHTRGPNLVHGCIQNNETKILVCHMQNLQIHLQNIFAGGGHAHDHPSTVDAAHSSSSSQQEEQEEEEVLSSLRQQQPKKQQVLVRRGNESLKQVMGQDEHVEFLHYQPRAFLLDQPLDLQFAMHQDDSTRVDRTYWFYMAQVLLATEYSAPETTSFFFRNKPKKKFSSACSTTWNGTTLLLTRYEYVDLFHTLKDWWNAYFAIQNIEDSSKLQILFLDSHPQGHYDGVWKQLFGGTVRHVRRALQQQQQDDNVDGVVCLESAIFVPPGYSSVLWNLNRLFTSHRCPAMTESFLNFVLDRHGLSGQLQQRHSVLLLDPQPHISHPRSQPLEDYNQDELQETTHILAELQTHLVENTNISSVQSLNFPKLSFRAQLKAIRKTHVLILLDSPLLYQDSLSAWAFFLPPGSTVLEIKRATSSSSTKTGAGPNPVDLEKLLKWKNDITYHSLLLGSESSLSFMGMYDDNNDKNDKDVILNDFLKYELVPHVRDVTNPGWDSFEPRYPPEAYQQEQDEMDGGGKDDDYWSNTKEKGDPLRDHLDPMENTFTMTIDSASDPQSCQLYYQSPTTTITHGCPLHEATGISYCQLTQLQIDPSLITTVNEGSAVGGETLNDVMGQSEDAEYLFYRPGAFVVSTELDPQPPTSNQEEIWQELHHWKHVLSNMTIDRDASSCNGEMITKPTLMVTRYEYVDLFHTMTDWWNAYFAARATGKEANDFQVLFMDAHPQGHLDSTWSKLFGSDATFVRAHRHGKLCLQNVIWVPAGYSSPLWRRGRSFQGHPCPSMTQEFVTAMLKAHKVDPNETKMQHGRITILDKDPSLVLHPRSQPNNDDRPIVNLQELKSTLLAQFDDNDVVIDIVYLDRMDVTEQLQLMRQTHVLIGHVDTGLSHLLFCHVHGTHILELQEQVSPSLMMSDLMAWKVDSRSSNNAMTHKSITGILDRRLSSDAIQDIVWAVQAALNKTDVIVIE